MLYEVITKVKFKVPRRGEKLQLLELSQRNAKYFRLEKEKQSVLKNPKVHSDRILNTIKNDLQLSYNFV